MHRGVDRLHVPFQRVPVPLGREPKGVADQVDDEISTALRRSPSSTAPTTDVVLGASLLFTDPAHLLVLRQAMPRDSRLEEITGYRYVTLMARGTDTREQFIVAVRSNAGKNTVVATMLVVSTFLRYEQELWQLADDAVERLEQMVHDDLEEIIRTRKLLREA